MTKHRVHLYVTMRVAFDDIEAETHEQAIELAKKRFSDDPDHHSIHYGEYADEITAAMVDEEGDEDFARTTTHEFPTKGF